MTRKILTFAVSALLCSTAFAAPLTPDQALARAKSAGPGRVAAKSSLELKYTQKMADGTPSAYIFAATDGKGFMLLSADDIAAPVLGYSDSEVFDADNMPPAMEWWIGEYARQVEFASARGAAVYSVPVNAPDLEAIAPLMKTKWNQDAPYNDQCPNINGVKAPTGCVATSFAQVMNYFQYPDKGQGSVRYTDSRGVTRSLNFNKEFDWANMLDEYTGSDYTDAEAKAVAMLMKACGFAVEMTYTADSSGAVSYKLMNAAVNYFKYDPGIEYFDRDVFSTDVWSRMVYDNIKNIGPVIYDGTALEGGHSFVCDGYDGNGYFHFNWGWGGLSDGYYVLDALNPESQGIGGAEGGFNYGQSALFKMQKPTENPGVTPDRMKIYGCAKGKLSGNNINFSASGNFANLGWGNGSYTKLNVNVGAIITRVGTDEVVAEVPGVMYSNTSGSFDTVSLGVYEYYSTDRVNPRITIPSDLPDGEYKVTLATRMVYVDDAPWLPMLAQWGCPNYCYLKIDGSSKKVSSADYATLEFEDGLIDSPLFLNRNIKLVLKVKNPTDEQLTLCFSPVLYRDNALQYEGDYMLLTVDAKEETEKTMVAQLFESRNATATGYGTYTLKILNRETGKIVATFGDYDMSSVSSDLTVKLIDLSIPEAPQENVTVGSRTFKNCYIVPNASDFDMHFAYKVTQGYLDKSVSLTVSRYNPETNKLVLLEQPLYHELPFMAVGEQEDITLDLDFSDLDVTAVYQARAGYMVGHQNKSMGSIYFKFDTSGVDGLEAEEQQAAAEYFNLQGVRIDKPAKGQVVIRRSGAKTERVVI